MRSLRDALGIFATGVTIVTGVELYPDSGDVRGAGVTISSFNTVSLSPPLVLWSLARHSKNLSCFAPGRAHNIHVLARDQKELALRFADSKIDKFDTLDYTLSEAGIPLLPGCAAHFECRTEVWHAGGDHIIIVARVEHFVTSEQPPLLFYRGHFDEIKV